MGVGLIFICHHRPALYDPDSDAEADADATNDTWHSVYLRPNGTYLLIQSVYKGPIKFSHNAQSWQSWHFFCCLKLKIKWLEKSVPLIIIHSAITNVNPLYNWFAILTVYNLIWLEVVQKCQNFQLCVLRENSIDTVQFFLSVTAFFTSHGMGCMNESDTVHID